jgi:4-methyl-5(b-hydroxyethyl)-thiazole monophosphate biosynthesis
MKDTAFVFFADGFEQIEALTPVDVLRRAGILTVTVSVNERPMAMSSHGVIVHTDACMYNADFDRALMLVLPGGMPGTNNLKECKQLKALLLAKHEEAVSIAAICAAPHILAQLGILQGKNATCYPSVEPQMTGAILHDKPFVKDGNIITGRGAGTSLHFSLALVEELAGKAVAQSVASKMMVPWSM